ncbi:hypothetical protein CDAR_90541 [Caerostris darwini]|uniref:Uncharacterized protein n=1 Tax=Caerostris darwini TaxID=1538125 RepID=A0AAV4V3X4_9ARAC|nr:hypothetical protein CDAR_90541 [Caerostris darwini]
MCFFIVKPISSSPYNKYLFTQLLRQSLFYHLTSINVPHFKPIQNELGPSQQRAFNYKPQQTSLSGSPAVTDPIRNCITQRGVDRPRYGERSVPRRSRNRLTRDK